MLRAFPDVSLAPAQHHAVTPTDHARKSRQRPCRLPIARRSKSEAFRDTVVTVHAQQVELIAQHLIRRQSRRGLKKAACHGRNQLIYETPPTRPLNVARLAHLLPAIATPQQHVTAAEYGRSAPSRNSPVCRMHLQV